MVFDENGNAVDAFPYSAAELERRAKELRGIATVTIKPSPWVVSYSSGAAEENT
jgi:hypothetical protein